AAREQVTMRRHAERIAERTREVRLRDATYFRQALDGPFLVGGDVHAVLRPEEAAEQIGILGHRRFFRPTCISYLLYLQSVTICSLLMRKLLVFQHSAREPLGVFDPMLRRAGFRIRYVNF